MPIIELKHVSKHFGSKSVLKGVSIQVEAGAVVTLVGPSGGGKSTLLRCINGLEWPDAGEVLIEGTPLTPKNATALRLKMGMIFQHFHLFDHLSALQNIAYAPQKVLGRSPEQAQKQAHELLQRVGLAGFDAALPPTLSGGQKQRVAIARALALEPKILLCDEPTSALDPERIKEVLNVLRSLAHTGITIIMVTHEMAFAREVSDHVLFMDQGSCLENAPACTFFHAPQHPRAQAFLQNVL